MSFIDDQIASFKAAFGDDDAYWVNTKRFGDPKALEAYEQALSGLDSALGVIDTAESAVGGLANLEGRIRAALGILSAQRAIGTGSRVLLSDLIGGFLSDAAYFIKHTNLDRLVEQQGISPFLDDAEQTQFRHNQGQFEQYAEVTSVGEDWYQVTDPGPGSAYRRGDRIGQSFFTADASEFGTQAEQVVPPARRGARIPLEEAQRLRAVNLDFRFRRIGTHFLSTSNLFLAQNQTEYEYLLRSLPPTREFDGFGMWVDDLLAAFDDTGDFQRPIYESGEKIGGVVFVVSSNSPGDLIDQYRDLLQLFTYFPRPAPIDTSDLVPDPRWVVVVRAGQSRLYEPGALLERRIAVQHAETNPGFEFRPARPLEAVRGTYRAPGVKALLSTFRPELSPRTYSTAPDFTRVAARDLFPLFGDALVNLDQFGANLAGPPVSGVSFEQLSDEMLRYSGEARRRVKAIREALHALKKFLQAGAVSRLWIPLQDGGVEGLKRKIREADPTRTDLQRVVTPGLTDFRVGDILPYNEAVTIRRTIGPQFDFRPVENVAVGGVGVFASDGWLWRLLEALFKPSDDDIRDTLDGTPSFLDPFRGPVDGSLIGERQGGGETPAAPPVAPPGQPSDLPIGDPVLFPETSELERYGPRVTWSGSRVRYTDPDRLATWPNLQDEAPPKVGLYHAPLHAQSPSPSSEYPAGSPWNTHPFTLPSDESKWRDPLPVVEEPDLRMPAVPLPLYTADPDPWQTVAPCLRIEASLVGTGLELTSSDLDSFLTTQGFSDGDTSLLSGTLLLDFRIRLRDDRGGPMLFRTRVVSMTPGPGRTYTMNCAVPVYPVAEPGAVQAWAVFSPSLRPDAELVLARAGNWTAESSFALRGLVSSTGAPAQVLSTVAVAGGTLFFQRSDWSLSREVQGSVGLENDLVFVSGSSPAFRQLSRAASFPLLPAPVASFRVGEGEEAEFDPADDLRAALRAIESGGDAQVHESRPGEGKEGARLRGATTLLRTASSGSAEIGIGDVAAGVFQGPFPASGHSVVAFVDGDWQVFGGSVFQVTGGQGEFTSEFVAQHAGAPAYMVVPASAQAVLQFGVLSEDEEVALSSVRPYTSDSRVAMASHALIHFHRGTASLGSVALAETSSSQYPEAIPVQLEELVETSRRPLEDQGREVRVELGAVCASRDLGDGVYTLFTVRNYGMFLVVSSGVPQVVAAYREEVETPWSVLGVPRVVEFWPGDRIELALEVVPFDASFEWSMEITPVDGMPSLASSSGALPPAAVGIDGLALTDATMWVGKPLGTRGLRAGFPEQQFSVTGPEMLGQNFYHFGTIPCSVLGAQMRYILPEDSQ